jgi:hypothetical protein
MMSTLQAELQLVDQNKYIRVLQLDVEVEHQLLSGKFVDRHLPRRCLCTRFPLTLQGFPFPFFCLPSLLLLTR